MSDRRRLQVANHFKTVRRKRVTSPNGKKENKITYIVVNGDLVGSIERVYWTYDDQNRLSRTAAVTAGKPALHFADTDE